MFYDIWYRSVLPCLKKMFGWGKKGEPSILEKLVSSTKKTRADIEARIAEATNNAKKTILSVLENHATTEVTNVCTINFEDQEFVSKIKVYDEMKPEVKERIVTDICSYLKQNGLEVFQSGFSLTIKWPVDDKVETLAPVAETQDVNKSG